MAFPSLDLIFTKLIIFLYFQSFFILRFPLISYAANLQGNETDKISLLELKKMIKDDPFGAMTSWNETIHFCEWSGVSCGRRHQRVTAINLSSMKLVGSMPSHIGNLSFLRDLNLENNSFSGEIPPEIGNLHRLEELYLTNNSFSGFIPSNISACKNLRFLLFYKNNLTGKIPSELGTLTNLQAINFNHNNLTGEIPHSLGNLSLLYQFFASFNNLLGEVPNSLCRLPGLEYLVVAKNSLSGSIPPCLFNHSFRVAIDLGGNYIEGTLPSNLFITLPQLIYLSVTANNFIGSIPVTLSNATNMQFFYAGTNELTGKVPDLGNLQKLQRFTVGFNHLGEGEFDDLNFLSSLINATDFETLELTQNNFGGFLSESMAHLSKTLIRLHLAHNQISGKIPRGISNLTSLEVLYLHYNKVSGEIPSEIGLLSNLKELALQENNFHGQIPSSFENLTCLTALSLRNNYLHGVIPASLGRCQNLEVLHLSHNNFNGYIPKEVLQLSSLSMELDLSHNQLVGPIPKEVGYLKNLDHLNLSYNSLSGHIPLELGSCVLLEWLDFTNNNFQGPIPPTMANLKGLQILQLSHNNLTGEVPIFLKDFKFLQDLNLSYNDFEGAVPITGIFNSATSFSIAGNRKLCGGITELNLPKCNITKPKKKKSKSYLKIVIPIIFGILGLTLPVFLICLRWFKRPRKEPFPDLLENLTLRVSYQTLFKSTNGFSSDNLLGMGGFGTVYKGTFDNDGLVFAVKVLNLLHHGASQSFVAECEVLRNVRHRNLVKVLSVCSGFDLHGNEFKALVYEYMDNGNLENRLHFSPHENFQIEENMRLSFVQRLNILMDVAWALNYLHNDCEPAIIHCDLKPSNILLDKNMTAHVSDFGLARFVQPRIQISSESHSSTRGGVRGTIGYAPPEYGIGSKPSKSGDVYSFGILILEMLTGRRPTDELFRGDLNLHSYAKIALPDRGMEIVDPKLLQERYEQTKFKNKGKSHNFEVCLGCMIQIGVACSTESPADRMKIGDVVSELNKSRKSLLV